MAHYSSLILLLLSLCGVSLTKALNNGFSVELIHRDSPKSPFYNPTETRFQRVSNAVRRSINRANHFNQAFSTARINNTPETTIIPDKGEYLMSYSVGTPPFKVYGIADTGSDIVWLQCKPCDTCSKQAAPMFDPSKSSTYKNIPCSSTTCQSLRAATCSSNDQCGYTITYGDRSQSAGDLSVDTLTLDSTSGSPISFSRTVIGCGHDDTVSFEGQGSGIVGLGGGPVSLITQLGPSIGGKFSYCLVPMFLESSSTSKLNFGDAAVVSGDGTVSTPIVQGSDEIFYSLTLESLSVGDNRIELGGSSSGSSEEGNIIIDSGTTLTYLPGDVYDKLESAVADVVKLERVDDPQQQLSLCYRTPSGQSEFPIITAHFSGADVQLNALNTFVPVADEIQCFAFGASQGLGVGAIFGNVAQQNLLVGYDLQKKILSFKPTDCTQQ